MKYILLQRGGGGWGGGKIDNNSFPSIFYSIQFYILHFFIMSIYFSRSHLTRMDDCNSFGVLCKNQLKMQV